jgi:hypothetical protein
METSSSPGKKINSYYSEDAQEQMQKPKLLYLTDIPHNPYLVPQYVYLITVPFMFPVLSDIANVPTRVILHT